MRVEAATLGSTDVRVTATFGGRAWSGNWDDDYEGTIYFGVLAEVEQAASKVLRRPSRLGAYRCCGAQCFGRAGRP